MTHFFLRSKAWVIFSLVFLLPFALQISSIFIPDLIHEGLLGDYDADGHYSLYNIWYTVLAWISTLAGIVLYLWYWAMIRGLIEYQPPGLVVNLKLFKSMTILLVIMDVAIQVLTTIVTFDLFPTLGVNEYSTGLIGKGAAFSGIYEFVGWLSLAIMIYMVYQAANFLRSAELKFPARFADCIGVFFLIVFHPIGVWFVQPRLNRLAAKELDPYLDHLVEE